MKKIKFSHDYPKLWEQTQAKLVHINLIDGKTLHEDLIEYDTKYSEPTTLQPSGAKSKIFDYYPLPKTQLIQLVFVGNKGIPFCTLRRFTPTKYAYYATSYDVVFDIVIEKEVSQ